MDNLPDEIFASPAVAAAFRLGRQVERHEIAEEEHVEQVREAVDANRFAQDANRAMREILDRIRTEEPPTRYWTTSRGQLYCKHGAILYGVKCVRCEREAEEKKEPDEDEVREGSETGVGDSFSTNRARVRLRDELEEMFTDEATLDVAPKWLVDRILDRLIAHVETLPLEMAFGAMTVGILDDVKAGRI